MPFTTRYTRDAMIGHGRPDDDVGTFGTAVAVLTVVEKARNHG